jgi:NAD(P)-dependent dehydrogenase (short-subunit alcohol dehydrogenase family)
MENPFSLEGKTIIITGASSGIGRQTAISCSKAGARVVLLGRDETRLQETLAAMNSSDLHLVYAVDLLDFEVVAEVMKDVFMQVGAYHGLVNAAGISTTLPLKLLSPEKMDHFFRTNVHGAIQLTKLFMKHAAQDNEGASVIFISSVMGMVGEMGKTVYSLTKGALISGARSLALELATRNVRVNTISPGVVVTPMSQSAVYSQDEESLNRVKSLHPLGLGKPEDVANACIYLLSGAARWVTGTNLVVDGGYTAR